MSRRAAAVSVAALCVVVACRAARPPLLETVLPDLSRMDPTVQQQIQEQHAALVALLDNRATPNRVLADGYGELGRMLLAVEYPDAAETALLNAQTLAPEDRRWPYYLGHVYRAQANPQRAGASFERARVLSPDDEATLVWLGTAYLDQGKPDAAAAHFQHALSRVPNSVAAQAGLGRVALEKRDYAGAVRYLNAALAQSPGASALRVPLGTAYRNLGDQARAEAELKRRGPVDATPPDPLMRDLATLIRGSAADESRGDGALDAGDWRTAVAYFKKAAAQSPERAGLHQKLGTALFLSGDAAGAMAAFEEAVRLDAELAVARYSLGVLLASSGRRTEAVEQLTAAVAVQPEYVEAKLALGDALRGGGRLEGALTQYGEVLKIDPAIADARFGYAMALVRLRRFREARDWLSEAAAMHPDQPRFAHALARVLSAAPDAQARDGARALMIVQSLAAQQPTIDVAETMGMTLAELGRFPEAVAMQREAISAAEAMGQRELARELGVNLARYERREPCRTPWRAADPVHFPAPALDTGRPRS